MFKNRKVGIKTIRNDNPNWYITDGYIQSPRAGFEIVTETPSEYKTIIRTCINRGWLKPVAYVTEKEFIWEQLGD